MTLSIKTLPIEQKMNLDSLSEIAAKSCIRKVLWEEWVLFLFDVQNERSLLNKKFEN